MPQFLIFKINTLEIKQNILARQDEEHIKLTIEEKITSNNSKIAEHVVTDAIAAVISEAMDDEEVLEEEEDEEVLEEEVLEDDVASLESEKEVASSSEAEEEAVASLEAEDDDSLTEPEISDDSDSEIKEVISEAVVVSAAIASLEEDEEEVFEIEIDDITYFATDEENGILYEVDKDGDVGKKVGIIKNGEPIFS